MNENNETVEEVKKKPDILLSIFDWLELFVFSFAMVLLILTFVARHSPVKGPSMLNTLHEKDVVIMSDLFYTPKQNDVVVFQSERTGYDEPYVKRIIATEGQTIDIDFDTWTVTVDGIVLDETYVNKEEGKSMMGSSYTYPLTVPEGMVFVMGDNRNHSLDSRDSRVGMIDERFILGRVVFRLLPVASFGTIK